MPTTPQRKLITRGAGHISVAPLGTELPATLTDAQALVAGTFAGFEPVGDTSTPVAIKENVERAESQSTQRLRPAATHVIKASATLESTLMALTAQRLAQVTEGTLATATGVHTIDGLQNPRQTKYYSVAVVGPFGEEGTVLWVGEVCSYSGDDTELAFTREEDTVLSVAWTVLEGDTLPGGTRWRVWGLQPDEVPEVPGS